MSSIEITVTIIFSILFVVIAACSFVGFIDHDKLNKEDSEDSKNED